MLEVPSEAKWHVLYTRPKTEKIVASRLTEMGIETYLPLTKVVRQWSDRKKKLELPLFPNYVFVKVDFPSKGHVFQVKEIVRFISIEKKHVHVRESEILAIKKAVSGDVDLLEEDFFQQGMKVRIDRGPLQGLEGLIIKRCGGTRLLLKIENLKKAYSINVAASFVQRN